MVVVAAPLEFVRGDANADTRVDITDAIRLLEHLFRGGVDVACPDAADANDDGMKDVSDVVMMLLRLFRAGAPFPDPTGVPDVDPTADDLFCD